MQSDYGQKKLSAKERFLVFVVPVLDLDTKDGYTLPVITDSM